MLLLSGHLRVVSVLVALWPTSLFWKETHVIAGQNLPNITANTSHSVGTINWSFLGGPTPEAFLLSTLRRSCSSVEISADGPEWDKMVQNLAQRYISGHYYFSCKYRCGTPVEQRKDHTRFICYCDKFCEDFGDCCFDFSELCQTQVKPETSNETCLADSKKGIHGHTVWNTCPQNWKEGNVRQKCQDEDQSDVMVNLPVFDKDSNVHYRNIFCARCNGAVNTQYWQLKLSCSSNENVFPFKLGNETILLPQSCLAEKELLPYGLLFQPKRCIPRSQDCHKIMSENGGSYCQTECLRYALPVRSRSVDRRALFRNPQCAFCNGFTPNNLDILDFERDYVTLSGWISLTIFFDFSSTSKSTIEVINQLLLINEMKPRIKYNHYKKEISCRADEVFDLFVGKCIVHSNESLNANCTVIAFNKTEYVQLPNDSVYVKPHNKMYNNVSYTIRDSRLLLCVSFSRNFTTEEKGEVSKHQISKTPTSLQILSSVGCIVSMVSLVLLLMMYILFAELRNLPGKIIINLTLSLLLYQSVFFSAVKKEDQGTCLVIAVLLHFFVLSSFTWMNVVAYDVHRIFTTSGGLVNRQNRKGWDTRRLVIYCLYAWGSPVLLVLACVITDNVIEGSIGYGQGEEECFISQPQAILYSFVLPVALLLIFNLFALGHTAINIIKTRKKTKKLTNQPHGSNIAVICVKMASVMGVTWILGIAANLRVLAFLWYPYVVLNSLQGLFIFLSFAASGKALELYKRKRAGILKKPPTNGEADNRRNRTRDGIEHIIRQTDGGQDTQGTHL